MSGASDIAADGAPLFDPAAPLTPSGNLRRRALVSRFVDTAALVAAAIALAVLAWLVISIFIKALPVLSFSFIFTNPQGVAGGGIANALLGTLVLVLLASVIALPIGILTGLYLTEFAGPRSRTGRALTLGLDLMQGLPTIVVALFVYGLIVLADIPLFNQHHNQTGFAGSVALAIVMLPLMARSSQEVLLLVPNSLREAADALGVSRWRTVLSVILPAASGGIATGAILSMARAAGETAPLLVCNSIFNGTVTQLNPFGHGVPSIPILILTTSDLANPDTYVRAWGAATVLLFFILLANFLARALLARSRRKMTG